MPVIKVIQPFRLVMQRGNPARVFEPGSHTISQAELAHWFIKACLAEGRAALLADAPEQPEQTGGGEPNQPPASEGDQNPETELVSPSKAELLRLTKDGLLGLAKTAGLEGLPPEATKDAIATALLAGQDGVTLLKGPDGFFVQKV